MKRSILVAGLLLLAACPLRGAQPTGPVGPMPQLGLATIGDQGNIEVAYIIVVEVWETATRHEAYTAADANGAPVQRVREVTARVVHLVPERRLKKVVAGKYRVCRDGKLLDPAAAAKLLEEPMPVVFASFEKPKQQFDPFYLQFFKPGMLMVGFAAGG
ncbi:MAG: hypothetical protein ACLQLG_16230 [Thermoguttaceae bacterium]